MGIGTSALRAKHPLLRVLDEVLWIGTPPSVGFLMLGMLSAYERKYDAFKLIHFTHSTPLKFFLVFGTFAAVWNGFRFVVKKTRIRKSRLKACTV